MTSAFENDQKIHTALEDALHTYPIASAPAGFSTGVMNAVRASAPIPQFQLSWVDYALTFFATSMIALTLVLWQFVPVQWIMRIRFQAFVFWKYGTRFQFTPILFVVLVLVLSVMLFSVALFRRPRLIIASQ